jgi:hypothetical protein
MKFTHQAGAYMADVHVASSRASLFAFAVAAGWIAFPFALQTVMHPQDAIRLQLKLQGLRVPDVYTAQQIGVGAVEAIFALCVLVLVQMVCTVLFYRKAQMDGASITTPPLWPLAAFFAGVLGNAAWFFGTGAFDPGGCVIGLSSAALTVGGELLCNKLGREFVFGPATAAPPQLYHLN